MGEKWKMDLARFTLPRIADGLEAIGKEMARYNDENGTPSDGELSDEAVAELTALQEHINDQREGATRSRMDLKDGNDGEGSRTEAWYRGQEDAYSTLDRVLDARLDGDPLPDTDD